MACAVGLEAIQRWLAGGKDKIQEPPEEVPGSGFMYSDINFIMLGALVERLSHVGLFPDDPKAVAEVQAQATKGAPW